jgi:hypothetical protein
MTKLYYHKTDGGAEYLCAEHIDGCNEGDLHSAIIRLDGEPEFLSPVYAAAPELLKALKMCLVFVDKYRILSAGDGDITAANARLIIKEAEGE